MSQFENMLRHVVQGTLPLADGLRELAQRASFDFGSNPAYVRYREPVEAPVRIEVDDVRRALGRCLQGEIRINELCEWAQFIVMTSAFDSPTPPSDDEDFYGDMWDVVNDLAAPNMFGPITRDWCADALRGLERYGATPNSRAG
jgi:hypothetical protein